LDEPAPTQSAKPSYPTLKREHAWLEAHREEYLGQWVAIEGDRLVAHGKNPREVYLAAREAGIRVPNIERVEKREETVYWGLAVMQSLSFDTEYDYSATEAIRVPVTLRFGKQKTQIKAFVDTGSSACIFKRGH
jgi:hypothetical protein